MDKNTVFDLQNPEMSSRPLGLQQMVPSSAQLRFQKLDKQMRCAVPNIFLGMDLFKCAIHGLDRSKMKDILTTAHENMDVIVETDKLKRINMEQATELWQEIVTDMEWNPVCKDFIFTVSGKTGKISSKTVADGKAVKVDIVTLDDGTPILFDSDWCEKFTQLTRKRKSHDITWEETEPKKQEPETDNNRDMVPDDSQAEESETEEAQTEEAQTDKNQIHELQELLQAEIFKGEEREHMLRQELRKQKEVYEKRIQSHLDHQNAMADDIEEAGKLDQKRIESLKTEIQTQKHALVLKNQQVEDLTRSKEQGTLENDNMKKQLAELRESVQALKQAQQIKKENTRASLTDWNMASSDSDDEKMPNTSTPMRKTIATVTKTAVPATLAKLGMSAYNPVKDDKIEYLVKFLSRTKDFTETGDFKHKKNLLYQAFTDDNQFFEEELTENDQKDMSSLMYAIINQEHGDSVDLIKRFDMTQIKQGESHKKYFFRVIHLYQLANNLSDNLVDGKNWKDENQHALRIYFKIEQSLPTVPRAKFVELMMETRINQTMTIHIIKNHLFNLVLKIYKDELKKAMGSQQHVLPEIDAIRYNRNDKKYRAKEDKRKCWICGKLGHLKKDCSRNSSPREPKTKSGNKANAKCYTCGGTGHFARECPSSRQNSSREHPKWPKKN